MAGPVQKLEQEFAGWIDVGGAVATGFGRSALWLALEAIGFGGTDVLVPDFICAQVPQAVRRAGGRPVFYRVPRDLTIPPESLAAALAPSTRIAIVPHYFGRVQARIAELGSFCSERNVVLVEDCALALGASLGGKPVGSFGELAVFSFTKSDWCYGGGMLATSQEGWLERALEIRTKQFVQAQKLALLYGLLRRADFRCNRPRTTRAAERAGRWLERLAALGDGDFYDAGRFDAAMPGFAARRAHKILRSLEESRRQRGSVKDRLVAQLRDASRVLFQPEDDAGDPGSFLLLQSRVGRAREWVEQAGRERVTLRHVWPAYQELEPGQGSEALEWLAQHLAVLEIHQRLTDDELEHIAQCLSRLGEKE